VIHDGSDEVEAAFAAYGTKSSGKPSGVRKADHHFETSEAGTPITGFGDSGSASRFFYSAKANKGERADSSHPTVKPLALMRYLTRLVTPPGGVVFDPFAGSGTTLEAAILEGFCGLGVEMTPDYWRDIEARLRRCQPDLAA
jgi:site-specific DNA-methyltransferase (adenine-specific)